MGVGGRIQLGIHGSGNPYATSLIDNGENLRVPQELLGHKDVQTTLNIYIGVSMDERQVD